MNSKSSCTFTLGGGEDPVVINVHLVEMLEHRILELQLGHCLDAGEPVPEKAQRMTAEPMGGIAAGRSALEHELAAQPLGFVAGNNTVVIEVEPIEQLVCAFERLVPRQVRLGSIVDRLGKGWSRSRGGDEGDGAKEFLHRRSLHQPA
jgi:hypothetical protein